jgi:putative FmdB family regulatory protein
MPIYTYKCGECGNTFDTFHDMSTRLTDCQKCEKMATLKRVLHSSISVSEKDNSGQLVKKHIEETKEALKEEARSIKRQDYKG